MTKIKQHLFTLSLSLLIAMPISSPRAAEFPLPSQPHIVVSGYGYVEQLPDLITLRFDATATAGNYASAKQQVDTLVAKAIKVAGKYHLDKKHINASKINAAPEYEWSNNQRQYRGEQVSRLVELTLTETQHYNDLVNDLLAAGISRLQSVELDFSQRQALQSQALLLALDDARQKANTMADHLGSSVQQVFQIVELNNQPVMSHFAMSARSESSDQTAPLSLAKQKIEQQVQVVFLLAN